MKKILALLLSLVLLLGTCAFAEEAPAAGHNHRLSDVVITYGDSTIDLSNIALCVDISPEGDAVLFHVDADGETAAELGFTKVDNLSVAHLSGALTGHKDFVTDPVVQLAKALQDGVDGLVGMLQSIDTRAAAENIMSIITQMADAAEAEDAPEFEEEPVEEPVEEPIEEPEAESDDENAIVINLADLSFHGDIAPVLEGCFNEVEGAEVDDSTIIPAGTYDVTTFYASEEKFVELLNMVYVKDEPFNLGDKLRDAGVTMTAGAAAYHADGVEATDITVALQASDQAYSAHLVSAKTTDESGVTTAYDLSCNGKGAPMGIKFTTFTGTSEDKTFSPASIDLANAINVDELSDEEADEMILDSFKTLLADATIPVLGPVLEAAYANGDLAAFLEAFNGAQAEDVEVPAA